MISWDRINSFLTRVAGYNPLYVAIEVALIWMVVYAIFRFLRGTRAAGAVKGLLVLAVMIAVLSRVQLFQRLTVLSDKFLALIAIALVVIFQPELRRALVRLGETPFFRATQKDVVYIAEQVSEACRYLSRSKFGAIVVVERSTGLKGLVEGGTVLNAELSSRLLQTIFFPGSALHDLAVVVKGRTIHAAGVQLPLAEPEDMPDQELGARHRAAVGLTKECDALAIVVSEETGYIRLAERGRLSNPISHEQLRLELRGKLGQRAKNEARAAAVEAPPAPEARRAEDPGETVSGQTAFGLDPRSLESSVGEHGKPAKAG